MNGGMAPTHLHTGHLLSYVFCHISGEESRGSNAFHCQSKACRGCNGGREV